MSQNELLAKDGYRVIAIAYKEIEKKKEYSERDLEHLMFNCFNYVEDLCGDKFPAEIQEVNLSILKIFKEDDFFEIFYQ